MKSLILGLTLLFSSLTLAIEIDRDLGITYEGEVSKKGLFKVTYQFSVDNKTTPASMMYDYFFNREFQMKADEAIQDFKAPEDHSEMYSRLCKSGVCKDLYANCYVERLATYERRACDMDFSRGDTDDVLRPSSQYGNIQSFTCEDDGLRTNCTMELVGHTKSIFIISAKTIANGIIRTGYIAAASAMTAIEHGLEALPVKISNNEYAHLERALDDKNGGDFSSK